MTKFLAVDFRTNITEAYSDVIFPQQDICEQMAENPIKVCVLSE